MIDGYEYLDGTMYEGSQLEDFQMEMMIAEQALLHDAAANDVAAEDNSAFDDFSDWSPSPITKGEITLFTEDEVICTGSTSGGSTGAGLTPGDGSYIMCVADQHAEGWADRYISDLNGTMLDNGFFPFPGPTPPAPPPPPPPVTDDTADTLTIVVETPLGPVEIIITQDQLQTYLDIYGPFIQLLNEIDELDPTE